METHQTVRFSISPRENVLTFLPFCAKIVASATVASATILHERSLVCEKST